MSRTKEQREAKERRDDEKRREIFKDKIVRWIKDRKDPAYTVFEPEGWVLPYLVAKHKRNFSWNKDRERVAVPEFDGRGCFDILLIEDRLPDVITYPAAKWERGRFYCSIFKSFNFLLFVRSIPSGDFLLPTNWSPSLGGRGADVYVEIPSDRLQPMDFK